LPPQESVIIWWLGILREEDFVMDTDTWATRKVNGGDLYLRRPPGGNWEVNYYERELNVQSALMDFTDSILISERLDGHFLEGQLFESPDEAAKVFAGILAGRSYRMPLPDFNEFGDLPERNHSASLAEVFARFGSGTAQRKAVTDRLQRVFQLAVATGHLDRLVVFGSYVSDVDEPNDVDVIW
jgi:hypothetical protein